MPHNPSSIGWIMWHMIYWWTTALDYNFGNGILQREDILWPGSVKEAKAKIQSLHAGENKDTNKYF